MGPFDDLVPQPELAAKESGNFDDLVPKPERTAQASGNFADLIPGAPTSSKTSDFIKRLPAGVQSGTGRTLQGLVRGAESFAPSDITESQFIASQVAALNAKAFPNGLSPDTTPLTRADIPPDMLAQWREDYVRKVGTPEMRIQASPTYQLGTEVAGSAPEIFGVDPKRDDEFMAQLATAAGELVPTLAAGAVAGPVGVVGQYGASAGEAQAQEALAAGKPEAADVAFLTAAGLGGLTEAALGVPGRLLAIAKRARKAGMSPGAFGKWANRNPLKAGIAKAAGEGAVREGSQEALEQVGGNLIASDVAEYDPARPAGQGVGRAAALGSTLGGLVGGGAAGVNQGARNLTALELKRERAGREFDDLIPKEKPPVAPVTTDVTPPKPEAAPKPEPPLDLAGLQEQMRGNQIGDRRSEIGDRAKATVAPSPISELPSPKPVPETGTPAPTPNSELRTPTGPLRFRAVVEEGQPASEMVIQPLTEELYDAVIHVEGLTGDFEEFRASHPNDTHLSRMLLPTGKFSGYKTGALNALVPKGIGTQWEDVTNGEPKAETSNVQRPTSNAPEAPDPARVDAPPAAPAPVAVAAPSPAPAPPAAIPLTPPTPAPTVDPFGTGTSTAGTAGPPAPTGGNAPSSSTQTPAPAALAAESGASPDLTPKSPPVVAQPPEASSQAGRQTLAAGQSSRIKNAKGVKRSSLTEEDGPLYQFVHGLGHKLPYFKPDNVTWANYRRMKAKALRMEVLTPKEKAFLERMKAIIPHNFEDNYGPNGEVMEAAYRAAQKAGLATELFTEQRAAKGGERDTDLDALRDDTGKEYSLRELFALAEQTANAHAERVSGRASAKEAEHYQAQAKADATFAKDNAKAAPNTELVAPDDLREGMSYTLKGTKLRVTDLEVDDAGRVVSVELDDGKKYMTQHLTAEDGSEVPALRADSGSVKDSVSQKRAGQEEGPAFSRRADVNRELNELKAKAGRTPTENARITELENELGQQDLFAVETRDPKAIEREQQDKADKAELERRRTAKLRGNALETTDNLFGERNEDKAGQGMFFSRGTSAGTPAAEVEARVQAITKDWHLPLRVEVLEVQDWPASARRELVDLAAAVRAGEATPQQLAELQSEFETGVEGRYVPGVGVFLNPRALASAQRAEKVLMHELVGHFGVETMLGDEFGEFARGVWTSFQGTPQMAAVVRDYAGDFANGRQPTTAADQRTVAREIVARYAEVLRERSPNLWQQLVAAVRRFLRETVGWKLDVSENDVLDALRRAEAELGQQTTDSRPPTGELAAASTVPKPEVKNLVVAHNLSAENLRHVLKLGGLPVPSLAVIRTDRSQFDSFGEITLLGQSRLVDTKQDKAAKVFNADVYSPRYPTVKYLLDHKSRKRVRAEIGPMLDKLPADRRNDFSVWNALSEVEEKGPERGMLEDETLAAAFLMDQGHEVAWRPVPEESKRYQSGMSRSDVFDMVRPTYRGGQPVDGPVRAAFRAWIAELTQRLDLQPTEKIFAGFNNSGDRRYLPHNLDTVVRLLKKELKDGEGFNYGVPSVRAKVAKQFRTIAAMQAAREDVITSEAMEKVKEEANAEFERLHNEAMPNRTGGKNSGFGTMDAFSDDLKAMVDGDFKHLREMYPGGEPFAEMRDFLEKLKHLPTEYFEAKVQRAMSLQEFDAAVVPDDLPADLSAELRKRGISVVSYQRGDKEARRAAVQQAAEAGGMAFSRVAQPAGPLADLKARREDAAARGITYAAQVEKLRGEGKTIPKSLREAMQKQAADFKEATFQMLRHPDFVAEQVRAVDAQLDELNTLKERQRILKQQGSDLESDARARLGQLEAWAGEGPFGTKPNLLLDELRDIPVALVDAAIDRLSGLKHLLTSEEQTMLDRPDLTARQKEILLDEIRAKRAKRAPLPQPRELPPDADVALATSTTLAGNADVRTWRDGFNAWLRKFASPTPEIPLLGPQARWNVPMRRFLDRIRAGGIVAQRDAETMTQDVLEPLLAIPRKDLDPNALTLHRNLARKLQFEQRRFEAQAQAMRAEIDSLAQQRASREVIDERREALADFEGNPPAKIAELQRQLTEAEAKLAENPMRLFNLAALYRDFVSRYQMLQPKQKGEFKLPGGLSIERVVSELDRVEKAIEASGHKAAIHEALDRHYRLMAQMEQSMAERGLLIPAALKNEAYFPHQVLDFTSQHLGRLTASTEERFRGYLVEPTGSRKPIETDYLQAVYRHVAQVLADNAHLDAVEQVLKPLDISETIKERVEAKAAASGRTAGKFEWRSPDNLPPGYRLFDAAKKLPLRMGYVLDPQTLANALGLALKDGDVVEQMKKLGVDFTLTPDLLQQALVAGEKQPWVLPNEIADALDGILDRQRAEDNLPGWQRRVRQVVGLWKLNTLFAPWHYVRYEWGNTISDVVDKLGGADPGMAKYLPRAFKEVLDFADKTKVTPEVRAAFEHRVLDSVTFAEVGKVVTSPAFAQLRSDTQRALAVAGQAAKDATFPLLPALRFLTGAKSLRSTIELSRLRESAFRYAKFLADLERIRNGQRPVYAGAYWKDVEALPTPEEQAAAISRKTFGDYGDLSVNGQWLRQNLIPFHSWTEINFRYHANLLRNFRDAIVRGDYGTAKESARAWAAFTALRLLLPYAVVHLWNTVGGVMAGAWDDDDDLEATLSDQDRRRFHIILGKDARGQTKVVYAPTAFSDVMSWFGGDNAARLAAEYARGDITFERMAQTFAKELPESTVNRVAQGLGPVGKGAFIAASGKQPFPDVTNMRSVSGREKFFAVVQTMTDREGTDLLRRAFDKDYYPRPASEVMQQLILQVRRRDPEQWAFYEVKEQVGAWKFKKTGESFKSEFDAPHAQALRGFRRAVYLGDVDAATRFYNRLLGFGYTADRLKASIRNQAPLAELNEKERKEFISTRTPAEREQIRRALQYWERLGTLKGTERGLFPAKGQRNFTPQPARLEQAMERFDRQPDAEVRRRAQRAVEKAGR